MTTPIFGLLPAQTQVEPGLQHATDHVARAIGVLISALRDKARFTRVVDIFVRPLQELEDVFWDLYANRRLSNATGVNLDVIGKIVKEARAGLSDNDYRAVLRVKGRVLRSLGTADDLIEITQLMLQSTAFTYAEFYPGSVLITVIGTPVFSISLLSKFLRMAKAAGIRLDVAHTTTPTRAFRYGPSTPTTNTAYGYLDGLYGAIF